MELGLHGRRAVVTGGSRGIGLATARALATRVSTSPRAHDGGDDVGGGALGDQLDRGSTAGSSLGTSEASSSRPAPANDLPRGRRCHRTRDVCRDGHGCGRGPGRAALQAAWQPCAALRRADAASPGGRQTAWGVRPWCATPASAPSAQPSRGCRRNSPEWPPWSPMTVRVRLERPRRRPRRCAGHSCRPARGAGDPGTASALHPRRPQPRRPLRTGVRRTLPHDVAGLVLLDPAHEEQFERVPGVAAPMEQMNRMLQWAPRLARLGLFRLRNPQAAALEGLPEAAEAQLAAISLTAGHMRASANEGTALRDIAAAVPPDLGDLPVRVVSAPVPEPGFENARAVQDELHRELVARSLLALTRWLPEPTTSP